MLIENIIKTHTTREIEMFNNKVKKLVLASSKTLFINLGV